MIVGAETFFLLSAHHALVDQWQQESFEASNTGEPKNEVLSLKGRSLNLVLPITGKEANGNILVLCFS